MTKIMINDKNSGTDITYLTIGEQAILLKVMGLMKNDNTGTQTIKASIAQKLSMFKILVAAGKRRKFIMTKPEMALCFEWYVEYLENLGLRIPNYRTLSYQFLNLSNDSFDKIIDGIDDTIQKKKITLDGKVVEQKIGESIIQAVVQPKLEPLIAKTTPRKEREKETSVRTKSVNDEIIHQILVAKNYGNDNQGDAFISDLVNLYKNDSILCKSILTGLKKNETCSQIFDRAEKRGSFSEKLTVLFYRYVDTIRSNKANNHVSHVKIVTPKVSTDSIASVQNITRSVQVDAESNIVKTIKCSIFDILQDAEELSGIECNEYSKIAFLKVISALTKRKKYFFKAQSIKLLELIEKLKIENELGQEFLDCLYCFAYYKKNLDELNQGV